MREVLVFIHGLVPEPTRNHTPEYRAIHDGLTGHGVDLPPFDGEDVVKVELWWAAGSEAAETSNLAAAQRNLAATLSREVPIRDRLTAGLMGGLRDLLQYAWADAFFYTSEDGETRTRDDVWKQILYGVPSDDDVDLTIICHSGGTLVAHDFLFYLFSEDRQAARAAYVDADRWVNAEQRWRIKRLVTMGSPLAPLMVRSTALVDKFAADPQFRLDLSKLGFDRGTHGGSDCRWLNVWDVHDILSFPVAGMYGGDPRVRDLYPDVGDWPATAHDKYWFENRAHRLLADNWG